MSAKTHAIQTEPAPPTVVWNCLRDLFGEAEFPDASNRLQTHAPFFPPHAKLR
jgi:hypothetical protein